MSASTIPAGSSRRNNFGDSPARVATAVAALVGFLLILASIGMAMGFNEGWAWKYYTPVIVLGVGVLAVGFFVVFNHQWLGDVVSGRAALSGLLVAVMCLAALVVWAAGTYLFSYKGQIVLPRSKQSVPLTKSWDLTKTQKFTLSDKSLQQIEELGEALRITVLGRLSDPDSSESRGGAQAEDLLKMYAQAASSKVIVEYIRGNEEDAQRRVKALADKLRRGSEELPLGTLVLAYKDQVKSLHVQDLWETRPYMAMQNQVMQSQVFKGEEVIASTIAQMLDNKKPKVYFAWGHGERDPEGRDGKGFSFAQDRLQGDNMEVAKLMLVSAEKVPADCDLLIVCGPKLPFQPKELEAIKEYVSGRKGRLLVCLDEYRPEADLGLDGLLAEFGIAIGHDKVLEVGRQRNGQMSLALDFGNHPSVSRLRENRLPVVFGPARSIRRLDEYRGDWSVDPLVSGSEGSYGETDLETYYAKSQASYQEGIDSPKPASYAVASWAGQAPMPGGRMDKDLGRVVVVGDSNWCSNQLFKAYGNESFFSATVKWMLGQEKRIVIEPKKSDDKGFALLPAQRYVTWFAGLATLALLVMVAGLTAWIRRR